MKSFIYRVDNLAQNLFVYHLLGLLLALIPKRRAAIFVSTPLFSDSPLKFYQYLKSLDGDIDLIWLNVRGDNYNNQNADRIYSIKSILGIYHFLTCKFIFTNNNEFFRFKSTNQVLVDFWHGTPVKRILNFDSKLSKTVRVHASRTNYRVSPSSLASIILAQAFGDSLSKYLEVGLPRYEEVRATESLVVKEALGVDIDQTLILYMPTYRLGYRDKNDGGIDDYSLQNSPLFNLYLSQTNSKLIVKRHPFERRVTLDQSENWIEIDDLALGESGINSMNLVASADVLITDFSSVVFDHLLTNGRLVIYTPDWEEYQEKRGTILNLDEIFRGFQAFNVEMVVDILTQGESEYLKARKSVLKDLFTPEISKNASHSLLKILSEKFPKYFSGLFQKSSDRYK